MIINRSIENEIKRNNQGTQTPGTSRETTAEGWLANFCAWAANERSLRAALVYDPFSQVQTPVSHSGNLRLLVLLAGMEAYLSDAGWVDHFDQPPASWVAMRAWMRSIPEYRLRAVNGLEARFVFIPVTAAHHMLVETGIPPEVVQVLRGCRQVLFDKDGLLQALITISRETQLPEQA